MDWKHTAWLFAFVSVVLSQDVIHMSQQPDHSSISDFKPIETEQKVAASKFSFASYYGDHMVLQRAPKRSTVWGYHPDPGERIIVQVKERGRIYSAIVDADGTWKVLLDAEASAGPFTISAFTETTTITLHDVLFGDVWVCSGQSNMQLTVNMIFNATEEMEEASQYHQIRIFAADLRFSKQPLRDLKAVAEKWSLPNNNTLGKTWKYFSAVCWLYGKYLYQHTGVPVGLVETVWGGTPVESWMSKDALAKCGLKPDGDLGGAGDNGELWNAMVNPFLPMTIYGAIWDQGEADWSPASKRNNYNCTFPAMIDDWRLKFSNASGGQTNASFPFGFVQLGAKFKDAAVTSGFPDIRWHQTADYGYVPNPRMQNVFMAVSVDLPDFTSPYAPVHTRDKQDVAHRLFLGGLSIAYGVPTLFQGPLPVKVTQLADNLVLDYGATWTLQVMQNEGFEICCTPSGGSQCIPDGKSSWVPTAITTSNTTHVTLFAGVCQPGQSIMGLRYIWRLSPCTFKRCAVYSIVNSLPAPPFVVFPKEQNSVGNVSFKVDWSVPHHL